MLQIKVANMDVDLFNELVWNCKRLELWDLQVLHDHYVFFLFLLKSNFWCRNFRAWFQLKMKNQHFPKPTEQCEGSKTDIRKPKALKG